MNTVHSKWKKVKKGPYEASKNSIFQNYYLAKKNVHKSNNIPRFMLSH
jgi:hypothetical protein